mmetsp:Transcript_13319/g.19586  ORF Transcript_13319/g.19586 Transcript_13319/m.19586 type:complete len:297 (-) Transcript_13319:68-958(-)
MNIILTKTILFACLILLIDAETLVHSDGCLICGEGKVVGSPQAEFKISDKPGVSCGDLEIAGLEGLISPEKCNLLPPLLTNCNCTEDEVIRSGVDSESDTESVELITPCPIVPTTGSSICGHGFCVTKFDAVLSLPGKSIECSTLENNCLIGKIPSDQCSSLKETVFTTCACQQFISSKAQSTQSQSPTITPLSLIEKAAAKKQDYWKKTTEGSENISIEKPIKGSSGPDEVRIKTTDRSSTGRKDKKPKGFRHEHNTFSPSGSSMPSSVPSLPPTLNPSGSSLPSSKPSSIPSTS